MAPRGYPVAMIQQAKEMIDDGLTPYRVGKNLGVARTTVVLWTNPVQAERLRARNRRYMRGSRNRRRARLLVERLCDLRAIGLTFSSIAKVLNLDYRTELTAEQVRSAFNSDLDPTQPPPVLEKAVMEALERYVPAAPFQQWIIRWQSSHDRGIVDLAHLVHTRDPDGASISSLESRLVKIKNGHCKRIHLDFVDLVMCSVGATDELRSIYPVFT